MGSCLSKFERKDSKLYYDHTSTQTNQIVYEDGTLQIKPKIKEQKIVNISQWMDVFLIFGSIYLVKHPSESLPLLNGMARVKRGDNMYHGWQ